MTKTYNKLVRDKIPEVIESTGQTCLTATLSDDVYLQMLELKLIEELAEYQESRSLEELADLIEVIAATAKALGCSWEELMQIREKKRCQRGGFDQKILLLEVSDTQKNGGGFNE